MLDKYKDIAVLVLSCDKYSDMWEPFGQAFKRNFPRLGLKVYLGANIKDPNLDWAVVVNSGNDLDWSTSYRKILEQIPEKYLLVFLEDLLLINKIDSGVLTEVLDFALENNALHIRFWASPRPNQHTSSKHVGMSSNGYPFTTTVCGLWDRKRLLQILIDGENPWMFEIMGSYRSQYYGSVYSTWEPICEYLNMIEKGRWIPRSLNLALKNRYLLDVHARKNRRGFDAILCNLRIAYYNTLFKCIPQKIRLFIMNFLRKILGCY